ncbi:hypothetical protein [Elizabethkingia anophelis]|uniref:hypothetical protein n=1 Tax=Elizabethkingia anophelis TaxID=1117645 RepID=UPI0021A684C0|nr:hypothetical protein [Elizabethkingia anophelis]
MANHRWNTPNSKVSATCVRCGILRVCVSKRYTYSGWEYILIYGTNKTLSRPDCVTKNKTTKIKRYEKRRQTN